MPFSVRKHGSQYQVITTDSGHVHGTHPSKAAAQAQLRALYANVPEAQGEAPAKKAAPDMFGPSKHKKGKRK